MSDNTFTFHKTPMGSKKLQLVSDKWEGTYRRGTIELEFAGNNPRITCWPRNPAEENTPFAGKPINAAMDMKLAINFLNKIIRAADSDKPIVFNWDMMVPKPDENGEKTWDKMVGSKLTFGKGPDGRVFISIRAKDRSPVTAYFGSSQMEWVVERTGDGDVEETIVSADDARAWAQSQMALIGVVADRVFIPWTKDGDTQGNGGQQNSSQPTRHNGHQATSSMTTAPAPKPAGDQLLDDWA